jgi:hypothetical protein
VTCVHVSLCRQDATQWHSIPSTRKGKKTTFRLRSHIFCFLWWTTTITPDCLLQFHSNNSDAVGLYFLWSHNASGKETELHLVTVAITPLATDSKKFEMCNLNWKIGLVAKSWLGVKGIDPLPWNWIRKMKQHFRYGRKLFVIFVSPATNSDYRPEPKNCIHFIDTPIWTLDYTPTPKTVKKLVSVAWDIQIKTERLWVDMFLV